MKTSKELFSDLIFAIALIMIVVIGVALGIVFGINIYFSLQPEGPVGSIIQSQEYSATSTPWENSWTSNRIKLGSGSLGSVVITSSGDLSFVLLDATSTPNTETNPINTSTQTLVSFPPNATVGTYTIDTNFKYGLWLEVLSGTYGTSTITFR
jgi:hypothetical protein